jgi:hypothetical protein
MTRRTSSLCRYTKKPHFLSGVFGVPIDQVKKAVTTLTNVFSPLKMAAARIICLNCKYEGKPKYRTSPVAWWLLWFFVGGFFGLLGLAVLPLLIVPFLLFIAAITGRRSVTIFAEKYGKPFRHPETTLSGLTSKGYWLVTKMKGCGPPAIPTCRTR